MSEFRIDQITNQSGSRGPDIAGITTFSATSGMVMPSGDTFGWTISDNVVKNGLVFYVDAGNSLSYPGSGNLWRDLSGQQNNLVWSSPSPTFTTYNNIPVISTSNTFNSLRAIRSYSYAGLRTGSQSYSASAVFRLNVNQTERIILSFGPANSNCNAESVHPIAISSSGKFVGGACGGLGTWTSSVGVTATTDRFWFVCTTYDGTTERVYVNGVFEKSALLTTNTPASSANAITLGWIRDDGALYSMNTSVGNVMIYNRLLSDIEIQQNYNALRGRYGI